MPTQNPLRAWVEIDLSALAYNIDLLTKRCATTNSRIMAIMKADAYGHDAEIVAPCAYRNGIRHFGVATIDEASLLRYLLPADASVYILSPLLPTDAMRIVADRAIAVVSSREMAQAISEAAADKGKIADIHLDVDTGMGRAGFPISEALKAIAEIDALAGARLTGICTHFACADEDPTDAQAQHRLFIDFLASLGDRTKSLALHACNSPATLVLGEACYYNLIRPGLLMYGIEPAHGMFDAHGIRPRPAMSIKASVTLCRVLPKGASISYGKTYRVPDDGRVYATIALGYGDGLSRRLGNVGWVLLHGKRAPICGRVCMDQFVVDVTGIGPVNVGDTATLIGRDGGEEITIGGMAGMLSTTPHEISTCLTARIPRIAV